jgi:hypothetical protein
MRQTLSAAVAVDRTVIPADQVALEAGLVATAAAVQELLSKVTMVKVVRARTLRPHLSAAVQVFMKRLHHLTADQPALSTLEQDQSTTVKVLVEPAALDTAAQVAATTIQLPATQVALVAS